MKSTIVSLAAVLAVTLSGFASAQKLIPDTQYCVSGSQKQAGACELSVAPPLSYDGSQIISYSLPAMAPNVLRVGPIKVECEVYDEVCDATIGAAMKSLRAGFQHRTKQMRSNAAKKK